MDSRVSISQTTVMGVLPVSAMETGMRFVMLLSVLLSAAGICSAASEKILLPDGSSLDVVFEYPEGRTNGAPLCLVLPPGAGTQPMVEFAVQCLVSPFAKRGWITACPLSPDGRPFFRENLGKAVALLSVATTRATKTH
jgi:hypothetical protein